MNFSPRDFVALVLAVGVMTVMVIGAYNARGYMENSDRMEAYVKELEIITEFWREMLLVIIGALAGYIAGNNNGKS